MVNGLHASVQHDIRISNADRELAVERLRAALDDGRITLHEYETRLEAVYAAVYATDLRQPLAELPGTEDLVQAVGGQSGVGPTVLRVGAGGLRETGAWIVPAHLQVQGGMGSVVLDFCKANIRHPITQIELKLGMGSVTLSLPNGASADVDGLVTTLGGVRSGVGSQRQAGAPHFVVSGRLRVGSVSVLRRRKIAGLWI
ncbi:unannotated protein [freshwater metagenome]|uniref:Unannotated protein n=1 Tax=freshwater metagenome TaxID=449393 RepID=A0A6J7FKF4_9ZZZZ|nr:DUF1707 domain-containing protein [Actinomycetota bacterium]